MKIEKVEAEGFGSFAESVKVDFPSLLYVCGRNLDSPHADSNAAGKSTLIDMVVWALYGRTANNRQKDQVINHFRDFVSVTLFMEGCTIKRSKKRGRSEKLAFYVAGRGWVTKDEDDISQAEGHLQKFLDFPFEMFCNSVFMGRSSKTVQFLEAKGSERLHIFSQLLDMQLYEEAKKLVTDDLRDIRDSQKESETYLRVLQDQEISIRKELASMRSRLSSLREASEVGKQASRKRLRALEQEAKDLNEAVSNPPAGDMQELQENKVQYQKRKAEAERLYHEYSAKLKLSFDLDPGDVCPTCLRELTEDDAIQVATDKQSLVDLVATKKQEVTEFTDIVKRLEERQEELRSYKTKQRDAEERIREIQGEMKLIKDDMLPPDITRISDLVEEKDKWLKENIASAEKERAKLEKLLPKLEMGKKLQTAFAHEIKGMLLDKVRKGLEYYSNLYLKILEGGGFSIHYPHQEKVQDKFEIILKNGMHKQVLEGYSGGETWRASFAILLAIRSVLDDRNNNPFNFLFIDDPFGPLDKTGKRDFLQLLERLSKENKLPQIIAAVPTDDEIPTKGNIVWVEKKNRVSRIAR